MAIGAGGDVSADNSSVAVDPFSASPSAHARNWRFSAPSSSPRLSSPLPSSFLFLSWGNRKILFLAFSPILSQWLWAGREENTPCVRACCQSNPKRKSKPRSRPPLTSTLKTATRTNPLQEQVPLWEIRPRGGRRRRN